MISSEEKVDKPKKRCPRFCCPIYRKDVGFSSVSPDNLVMSRTMNGISIFHIAIMTLIGYFLY
jgi:hypothetical protein